MLGKCCALRGFLKIDKMIRKYGYGLGPNVRDAGNAGRGRLHRHRGCMCNAGDTALLTSWVCSSVCPARPRHRLTDRDRQTETDRPKPTDAHTPCGRLRAPSAVNRKTSQFDPNQPQPRPFGMIFVRLAYDPSNGPVVSSSAQYTSRRMGKESPHL